MRRRAGALVAFATVAGVLVALVAMACGSSEDAHDKEIRASAEIVEADAPVRVEVTQPAEANEDYLTHAVRVTWMGETIVRVSDARFTHQIQDGDGTLVLAGRGCSPDLQAPGDDVQIACTADLQLIDLHPGDSHEYRVRVYPAVGELEVNTGTYVAQETIQWTALDAPGGSPVDGHDGEFTVRLTYDVQ